jgi:cytidine deaminase
MHSWEALFAKATTVAAQAWSPYSGIQVGCALVTESGGVFLGCNVENASYGLTICAERTAIFSAVAAEGPSMKIQKLAVIALGKEFPPCGACRQVIAEFASPTAELAFMHGGKPVICSMRDLLPAAFAL